MSNITDKTNEVKLLDKLLDKVIEARSHNLMGRSDQTRKALDELWYMIVDPLVQPYIDCFEKNLQVDNNL